MLSGGGGNVLLLVISLSGLLLFQTVSWQSNTLFIVDEPEPYLGGERT